MSTPQASAAEANDSSDSSLLWAGPPLPGPDAVDALAVLPQFVAGGGDGCAGDGRGGVRHQVIHEADNEWSFLIGIGLAMHANRLHAAWAQAPAHTPENSVKEVVRSRTSTDGGKTWSAPRVLAPGHADRNNSHGAFHVVGDALWYYAATYEGIVWGKGLKGADGLNWVFHNLRTEAFRYDVASDSWHRMGEVGEMYPLQTPLRLPDGGWLMAGMDGYGRGAVMISQGDAVDQPWRTLAIPLTLGGMAEANVLRHGNDLLALLRPMPKQPQRIHLSRSSDSGRTWSDPLPTALPCASSKIAATTLSTGQHVLLFNFLATSQTGEKSRQRDYPVIAVTAPGQAVFRAIWRLRPDLPPAARFSDHSWHHTPQWGYPYPLERDGMLYVAYHSAKEDACLSIIPISDLRV